MLHSISYFVSSLYFVSSADSPMMKSTHVQNNSGSGVRKKIKKLWQKLIIYFWGDFDSNFSSLSYKYLSAITDTARNIESSSLKTLFFSGDTDGIRNDDVDSLT